MTKEEVYLKSAKFLNEEAVDLIKKTCSTKNIDKKIKYTKQLIALRGRINKEIKMYNHFLGEEDEESS